MNFDDFDTQIQSDEFAWMYEDFAAQFRRVERRPVTPEVTGSNPVVVAKVARGCRVVHL